MAFEEVCEETFGKTYAILFYGETVSLFFPLIFTAVENPIQFSESAS